MPTLILDDCTIETSGQATILEVARAHGIVIPTLCADPELKPFGGCRLCLVEVEGRNQPVAACTFPVADGMVVRTDTPALRQERRFVLRALLRHFHDAGYADGRKEDNELYRWAGAYGLDPRREMHPTPFYPIDSDPNPFVWVDLNKCIRCWRCVRACAEIQGRFVWGMKGKGKAVHPIAGLDTDLLSARCESCGACVAHCPTGALDNKPSLGAGRPDRLVASICSYCGVGCTLEFNVKDERIIRVTSRSDAPVNGNHLCVKGRYGHDYIHHSDRVLRPRVRRYLLEGDGKALEGRAWEWVETDWETALTIVADKLLAIRRVHGADTIGFLSSAKCLNEENYLMNKLARQVFGVHHIDHCARLCHSSSTAALSYTLGSAAMSNSMDDIAEQAAVALVIGSNTTEQHPVFATRLRQAVLRRGLKLIVADPRRIDLVDFAALHLRHRPGTDIALLNGLMHLILTNGWEDRAYIAARTEGFEALEPTLRAYTPERVSAITGVPERDLHRAAKWLGTLKPGAAIWGMGITQHTMGVANVYALSNLQLMRGNIGVAGGGANPLRGQNNVQGACDMGALPNVYPGYQPVTDGAVHAKFQAAWGRVPEPKVGMTVTEMIPALGQGRMKALYIMGENPVMSDPDVRHVRQCLAKAEFVVLQEIFPTETSHYADVLLPGVSVAEKSGTVTNTERRVQRVRQAIAPLGEAKPDWQILTALAQRLLASELGREIAPAPYREWNYTDTSAIIEEIRALTPLYAGVTYARLEAGERLQWPVPSLDHPGTPVLHTERFPIGKARFVPVEHLPEAELPDRDYPYLLTTGRVLYHWHGAEMTRRVASLMQVYGEPRIELNPQDAEALRLNGHRRVRVVSRRGEIVAPVWVTERVPPGIVFAHFHFPEANANELTHATLDPISKIPAYKISAVRVEPV